MTGEAKRPTDLPFSSLSGDQLTVALSRLKNWTIGKPSDGLKVTSVSSSESQYFHLGHVFLSIFNQRFGEDLEDEQ